MTEKQEQPMSWGKIIAIMVINGLAVGLIIGTISTIFKLPHLGSMATSGVGASIGVTGALLITRRAALLSKQKAKQESKSEGEQGQG